VGGEARLGAFAFFETLPLISCRGQPRISVMYRSTCRYHVYSLGGYRALGANPSIGLCQVSRHRSAIGAMAESENATY